MILNCFYRYHAWYWMEFIFCNKLIVVHQYRSTGMSLDHVIKASIYGFGWSSGRGITTHKYSQLMLMSTHILFINTNKQVGFTCTSSFSKLIFFFRASGLNKKNAKQNDQNPSWCLLRSLTAEFIFYGSDWILAYFKIFKKIDIYL